MFILPSKVNKSGHNGQVMDFIRTVNVPFQKFQQQFTTCRTNHKKMNTVLTIFGSFIILMGNMFLSLQIRDY